MKSTATRRRGGSKPPERRLLAAISVISLAGGTGVAGGLMNLESGYFPGGSPAGSSRMHPGSLVTVKRITPGRARRRSSTGVRCTRISRSPAPTSQGLFIHARLPTGGLERHVETLVVQVRQCSSRVHAEGPGPEVLRVSPTMTAEMPGSAASRPDRRRALSGSFPAPAGSALTIQASA